MRINKAVLITFLILGFNWVLGMVAGAIVDTLVELMQSGQLTGLTFGQIVWWVQLLRLPVQAIGTYLIVRHFIANADDGEKRKRSGYRNDLAIENNLHSINTEETDAEQASKRKFQQQ